MSDISLAPSQHRGWGKMADVDWESERQARAMRDARIVTAWLSGESLDQIAKTEGISRERARQVVKGRPGLAEERHRRRRGEPFVRQPDK